MRLYKIDYCRMNSRTTQANKSRETINPYLHFGYQLFLRIRWDLSPYSWTSRRRIRGWKNKFQGEKAIILCNGPSLNKVDLNALEKSGIFSFGLNKINLIFDRTQFRPSAIVAVNPYVIEQNAPYFNRTHIPLFIDVNGRNIVLFRRNVHFMHGVGSLRKFSRDCSISIVQGYTVTFVAMQLAFHMGFQRVALVGCDHSFFQQGPPNKTVIAGKTDPDHFDPRYFAKGAKWHLPDLLVSELQYDTARETYEQFGREIVNCTVGGKLEIFRRMPLKDFLMY